MRCVLCPGPFVKFRDRMRACSPPPRIPLSSRGYGISCSAGERVHFVYDASGRYPTHAAVKGGPRVGLCGVQPGRSPSACAAPDGGLCRACAEQVERIDGVWRVKKSAPALHATRHVDVREDDRGED